MENRNRMKKAIEQGAVQEVPVGFIYATYRMIRKEGR